MNYSDVEFEKHIKINTIYNIDCYEGIKLIPDKSIDCIYTDIPYLLNTDGGGGVMVVYLIRKRNKWKIFQKGLITK